MPPLLAALGGSRNLRNASSSGMSWRPFQSQCSMTRRIGRQCAWLRFWQTAIRNTTFSLRREIGAAAYSLIISGMAAARLRSAPGAPWFSHRRSRHLVTH
jgi:hypothetical protein